MILLKVLLIIWGTCCYNLLAYMLLSMFPNVVVIIFIYTWISSVIFFKIIYFTLESSTF